MIRKLGITIIAIFVAVVVCIAWVVVPIILGIGTFCFLVLVIYQAIHEHYLEDNSDDS